MRCKYQCNQKHFEDYYTTQVGHGLSVFTGPAHQKGYGIGNVLSGLTRTVVPLLKKTLLKEGVRTGVNVATDVLRGQKLSTSVNRRGRETGQRLLNQAFNAVFSPRPSPPGRRSPLKRKRKTQTARQSGLKRSGKGQSSKSAPKKRKDIFG